MIELHVSKIAFFFMAELGPLAVLMPTDHLSHLYHGEYLASGVPCSLDSVPRI